MEMEYKRALREADKTIVDAYDELGKSKIEELKYSTTKTVSQPMCACMVAKDSILR